MRSIAVLVLASFVFVGGCSHSAVLRDPSPAYVPAGMPLPVVRERIVTALPRHRWVLEGEDANRMFVAFRKGSHVARVLVTYDTQYVTVQYATSDFLDYAVDSNGTRYIHRNYNAWVQNLVRDIQASLSSAQAGAGVPPGGGVQVIVVPTEPQ